MALGSGMKIAATKKLGQNWLREKLPCPAPYFWCYPFESTTPAAKVFVTFPDGHQEKFKVDLQYVVYWSSGKNRLNI